MNIFNRRQTAVSIALPKTGRSAAPGRDDVSPVDSTDAVVPWLKFRLHPNISFWAAFFLLNGLLFLPLYALNTEYMSFFPLTGSAAPGQNSLINSALGWRENLDIFRINLEFVLVVALWTFVAVVRRRALRISLFLLYILILIYYIYEGTVRSLWQAEPVFYNHYYMAMDGIGFLLENLRLSPWVYLGVLVVVVLAGRLLYELFGRLLPDAHSSPNRITRLAVGMLTIASLLSLLHYHSALADPRMVVSSIAFKVERNIDESRRVYRSVGAIDDRTIRRAYAYEPYLLNETPDIYIIFLESYGSVLYKRPDYKIAYEILLMRLENRYKNEGWFTTTALSEAPTWGGGSWMSYTSALFGIHIEEHPYFLSLFEKYQTLDYPDLGHWLTEQGYRYYRASSLSKELNDSLWNEYISFYGVDNWIRYRDLNYVGQRYGWGPAPPDQYVVNFAEQHMEEGDDEPHLFFFITQNSHYPWMPIPEIADDWRTLNVPEEDQITPSDDDIEHQTRRMNYFHSIEYELEFLTEFILEEGDENDIFVLVGDHQPPRVSRRADGFGTPMHIISRDQEYVDSFAEYGFVDGLRVQAEDPPIKHEGFYSMFARSLIQSYGKTPTQLPDYLPEGVNLPTKPAAE